MIKGVIFDMDGVIVDSEPLWEQMLASYLHAQGVPFVFDRKSKQLINLYFRGRKQKYITDILKKKYHVSGSYQKILDDRLRILLNLFDQKLKQIPGTIQFIKKLHAAGYPLALASSSPRRIIRYVLKKFHLKKFFRQIISADDVRLGKPSPDIFLKAAKLLKTQPKNILVIEDSISGIQAAHNAGMKCLALKKPYTAKKYLKTTAMAVKNLWRITLADIRKI